MFSGEVQVAEIELAFSGEDLGEVGTAAEVEVGFLLDAIENRERFQMLMLGLGGVAGRVCNSRKQNWPSEFTYDPVRQIYQLKLIMVYNPGHYKLLIDSPLFPEQCAAFTVTK